MQKSEPDGRDLERDALDEAHLDNNNNVVNLAWQDIQVEVGRAFPGNDQRPKILLSNIDGLAQAGRTTQLPMFWLTLTSIQDSFMH